MSEPITCIVFKEWTSDMADAAYEFAAQMSDEGERQATIVGMLHIAWPRLLEASSRSYVAALHSKTADSEAAK
jgi:hypothetical protein